MFILIVSLIFESSIWFLQNEFGNFEGSPKWTSALMRWKLSDANPWKRYSCCCGN